MVPWFVEAGADVVTFHFEATKDPRALLATIRAAGKKAGISIKPGTPVEKLEPYLSDFDLVLIMSVEPGFGGQKFMPEMLAKVRWLAERKKSLGLSFYIEIDGGINAATIGAAADAGVEIFVAGSAVYSAPDPVGAYQQLLKLAESGSKKS
jgi:ribulose-phosphate 3-epimerase